MPPVLITRVVFGLVKNSPDEIASAFDDLSAWMREHTGVELERKPAATYADLAMSVREGSSDVAWLPPVVYGRLAEGVTPLGCVLREGEATYSSAVIVREDASLRSVSDLEGVRAGWVDPWSAAGYVVPRIELARAGVDPLVAFSAEEHYGSHREMILALGRGDVAVAATYARANDDGGAVEGGWSRIPEVRVRVLATYGPIPADVLAVRRNLDPVTHERVLDAFRKACADDAARPLVRAVFGGDELREGVEPGHERLRRAIERATANGLFD